MKSMIFFALLPPERASAMIDTKAEYTERMASIGPGLFSSENILFQ